MPGSVKRLATNPILRQGVHSYFLSKDPLTAALHYLLALATVLFVIWPKSQYLRVGSPSDLQHRSHHGHTHHGLSEFRLWRRQVGG